MADPVTALTQSLSDDPEVRAAAKALALDSIRALRRTLNRGSPALQLQVASRMLPAITKALAESRADENDELRTAVATMNTDIQRALGLEVEEVPVDGSS